MRVKGEACAPRSERDQPRWRRNRFQSSGQCRACKRAQRTRSGSAQLHAVHRKRRPGKAHRTTRSRWRRRSEVLMREMPAIATTSLKPRVACHAHEAWCCAECPRRHGSDCHHCHMGSGSCHHCQDVGHNHIRSSVDHPSYLSGRCSMRIEAGHFDGGTFCAMAFVGSLDCFEQFSFNVSGWKLE